MAAKLPTGEVDPITVNQQNGFINPTPRVQPTVNDGFINSVFKLSGHLAQNALNNLRLDEQAKQESDVAKAQFDYLKNKGAPIDLRQQTIAYQQHYEYLTGKSKSRKIYEELLHNFQVNPEEFLSQHGSLENAIATSISQVQDDVKSDQYQLSGFISNMNQMAANLMQLEAKHLTEKQQVESERLVNENIFYHLRDNVFGQIKQHKDQTHLSTKLPATNYDGFFIEYGNKYGVSPNLLKAIAQAESNFNPKARSPAGALGLMQFMKPTAEMFGLTNRLDPEKSIEAAAKFVKYLSNKYNGNTELILAGYNAGEGAVKQHGGVPPFRETRTYIDKIKNLLDEDNIDTDITSSNFQDKTDWQTFLTEQAFIHPNGRNGALDATANAIIRYARETNDGGIISRDYFSKIGLEKQFALMHKDIFAVQMGIDAHNIAKQKELLKIESYQQKQRLEEESYALKSKLQLLLMEGDKSYEIASGAFIGMVDDAVRRGLLTDNEAITFKGKYYSTINKEIIKNKDEESYALKSKLQLLLMEGDKSYEIASGAFIGMVDDAVRRGLLTDNEAITFKGKYYSTINKEIIKNKDEESYALKSKLQLLLMEGDKSYEIASGAFIGMVDDAVREGLLTDTAAITLKGKYYNTIKKEMEDTLKFLQQHALDTAITGSLVNRDLNAYSVLTGNLTAVQKSEYIDQALLNFTKQLLGEDAILTPELILSNDNLLKELAHYSSISNTGSKLLTSYFNGAAIYLLDDTKYDKFDQITDIFRKLSNAHTDLARKNTDAKNYELLKLNSQWMIDSQLDQRTRINQLRLYNERLSSDEIKALQSNFNPESLPEPVKKAFEQAIKKLSHIDSYRWLGWVGGNNVDYWDRYNFTREGGDGRRELARWLSTNIAARTLALNDENMAIQLTLEQLPNTFGLYFNDHKDWISKDRPSLVPKEVADMSNTIDVLREVTAQRIRDNPSLVSNIPDNIARNIKSTDLRVSWDWRANRLNLIYVNQNFFVSDDISPIPIFGNGIDIMSLNHDFSASGQNKVTAEVARLFAAVNQESIRDYETYVKESLQQLDSQVTKLENKVSQYNTR
jgi:hypothetical protein